MPRKPFTQRQALLKYGVRSGLEEQQIESLIAARVRYAYEKLTLTYEVREVRKYKPDIVLLDNGIVVEMKGRFVTADRKKIKLIRIQYPELALRMVFSNSRSRISKQSQTTYGMWAEAQGIPYADKQIPASWIAEGPHKGSLKVIERLLKET